MIVVEKGTFYFNITPIKAFDTGVHVLNLNFKMVLKELENCAEFLKK